MDEACFREILVLKSETKVYRYLSKLSTDYLVRMKPTLFPERYSSLSYPQNRQPREPCCHPTMRSFDVIKIFIHVKWDQF